MPMEQVRRLERRERILHAALKVFSAKGYREAAVDDIAIESDTSKGGVYFHFPNKQSIFLVLLDRMVGILRTRIEAAILAETDPIRRADAALQVLLQTFGAHRTLARLFLVEALGAGRDFHDHMGEIHGRFAEMIRRYLDEAVREGLVPPMDTTVASQVWFGALNEVVTAWVLTEPAGRLEDRYPTLRALLLRGIGVSNALLSEGDDRDEG